MSKRQWPRVRGKVEAATSNPPSVLVVVEEVVDGFAPVTASLRVTVDAAQLHRYPVNREVVLEMRPARKADEQQGLALGEQEVDDGS